jgi:hypothetical protein
VKQKKIRCTADLEKHFIYKVMARKEEKTQKIPLAPLIRGSHPNCPSSNLFGIKILLTFDIKKISLYS